MASRVNRRFSAGAAVVAIASSVLFIPPALAESAEMDYMCGLAMSHSSSGLPIEAAQLQALLESLEGATGPISDNAPDPIKKLLDGGALAEALPGGSENAEADEVRGLLTAVLALAQGGSLPATATFDSKLDGQTIKVGESIETQPISGSITFGKGLPEQLPAFEVPIPVGAIEMAGSVQRPNRVEDYPMTFAGDSFVLGQDGGVGSLSTGTGPNITADVPGTYELRAGELTFSLVNETLDIVSLFVCMPQEGANPSIDSFTAVGDAPAPAPPAPAAPAAPVAPEIVPAAVPAAPERPTVVQTDIGQSGLPSWLPLGLLGLLGAGAMGAAHRLTRVSSGND